MPICRMQGKFTVKSYEVNADELDGMTAPGRYTCRVFYTEAGKLLTGYEVIAKLTKG